MAILLVAMLLLSPLAVALCVIIPVAWAIKMFLL